MNSMSIIGIVMGVCFSMIAIAITVKGIMCMFEKEDKDKKKEE